MYYIGNVGFGREVYHSGVKGQVHGVRRYQYEDGSLTPLGRVHYGVGQVRDAVKRTIQKRKKASEDRLVEATRRQKLKNEYLAEKNRTRELQGRAVSVQNKNSKPNEREIAENRMKQVANVIKSLSKAERERKKKEALKAQDNEEIESKRIAKQKSQLDRETSEEKLKRTQNDAERKLQERLIQELGTGKKIRKNKEIKEIRELLDKVYSDKAANDKASGDKSKDQGKQNNQSSQNGNNSGSVTLGQTIAKEVVGPLIKTAGSLGGSAIKEIAGLGHDLIKTFFIDAWKDPNSGNKGNNGNNDKPTPIQLNEERARQKRESKEAKKAQKRELKKRRMASAGWARNQNIVIRRNPDGTRHYEFKNG